MNQLNEEVRCLRQTLSHLNYRIKHETDKETKNKLMGDYNSYNLIIHPSTEIFLITIKFIIRHHK